MKKAENELDESHRAPLTQLQHWLQLNYEIENKHFEMKKHSAEKELENAKEMVGIKCHCSPGSYNVCWINFPIKLDKLIQLSHFIV